jgi:hypothetical protein
MPVLHKYLGNRSVPNWLFLYLGVILLVPSVTLLFPAKFYIGSVGIDMSPVSRYLLVSNASVLQ